jgi:hypothetical protein
MGEKYASGWWWGQWLGRGRGKEEERKKEKKKSEELAGCPSFLRTSRRYQVGGHV